MFIWSYNFLVIVKTIYNPILFCYGMGMSMCTFRILLPTRKLIFMVKKIKSQSSGPNSITRHDGMPIFEWYMIRCGNKIGYHKDNYLI